MLSVQYAAAADNDNDDDSRLSDMCLELADIQNCKFCSGINLSC